jgi:hypothetical protein
MNHNLILYLLIVLLISCKQKSNQRVDSISSSDTIQITESNVLSPKPINCPDSLLGSYHFVDQYEDSFYLTIGCSAGKQVARLIAPAPQGEHGMMYVVTEPLNFSLLDSNKFILKSLDRELFYTQPTPTNLDSLLKNEQSGGENYEVVYQGKLNSDKLTIACLTKIQGNCYFDRVTLIKIDR